MPRLKPGQKPTSKDDRTIDRAIARLAHEAYHLREDFAALKVIELAGFRSAFMAVTVAAYQSDMLVRLMRVLERDARVGSFWFLSDCGLVKAERDRINRLKSLSKRLLAIRNGTFLHIDERELFDPQRVYRKKIKWRSDIEPAIDLISSVVNRLYGERLGKLGQLNTTIADMEEIFARGLPPLRK